MDDHRNKTLRRREFVEGGVGAALALTATSGFSILSANPEPEPVRVGFIGTGNRGRSLLNTLLALPGIKVPALCDIDPEAIVKAKAILKEAEQPEPEAYTENETIYQKLLEREDLDAVLIATPWNWHTPMAVDTMKAGKYAGVEVPAALSVEECWQLVDTHEETGVPCMMLENWSFRRDNLAVLNMVRKGMFGEIVHCHCAHSHDCVDHWFFDREGNMRWGADFLIKYNRDQYPTHSQGPVLSWLDINRGDAYATLTSVATASKGINDSFVRRFGPDHPNAKRQYKQGDIVTSFVRTQMGKTIVINYDMQLPRPYDNRWMLQGTRGVYNEQRNSLYLVDRSPEYHEWESFEPYQKEFEHPWWKAILEESEKFGHGGTDYLELKMFIQAVREKTQTPIDVYDSATMSSVVGLSGESIANGSMPVECPDFTRGRWKTRKPAFAVT
ncbi:MAG: Gfo/Idh/MocA family oxidoreductase [Candidatus Omnitrophica bacterium]|nr:Gfo/Idh/MocA family oxidoreductase [Candidatus Omnitrophota bacterium]